MQSYHETYTTRNHKYPINLPNDIYPRARLKAKEAGFLELAPYLRAIIIKEVNDGELRIQDILSQRTIRKMEWDEICRREHLRSSNNFKISKKFIDKIRKLGVYFKHSLNQQLFEF